MQKKQVVLHNTILDNVLMSSRSGVESRPPARLS